MFKKISGIEEVPIVAEINITPLTDIFLVLLIIFMVTTSALSHMSLSVQLPQAQTAEDEGGSDGVLVTLLPTGQLRVNHQPCKMEELESQLQLEFKKMSSRWVILEGDRQAFLGLAVSVMDRARRVGAEKFSIATLQEKRGH